MLRVIFYVTGVFMSSQYAGVSLQAETTQRNVEAGSPGTFWVQKWLDSQTLKNKKGVGSVHFLKTYLLTLE